MVYRMPVEEGGRYIYDSHGIDSQLTARDGQTVTVIRALTADEADIEDMGPMHSAVFEDGYKTDLFEDELFEVPDAGTPRLPSAAEAEALAADGWSWERCVSEIFARKGDAELWFLPGRLADVLRASGKAEELATLRTALAS